MTETGIREGTAEWRSFHFRPPDPVWAPASSLDRARRELSDFNWRLTVWWSPTRRAWDYAKDQPAERPGRWRVVEWMPNKCNWETTFYWEGANGEYRDPLPIEPILERLGRANVPTNVADKLVEEAAQKREATRVRELREANTEMNEDLSARHLGIRQTFGPGYIRRRRVPRKDLRDTNHKRFVKEHLKKWDGSA